MFSLRFTSEALDILREIESQSAKVGLEKQIKKALGYLQINSRHPSLQTHVFHSIENPFDPKNKVFEAYAQNRTPGAYRIFWCYGPQKKDITILAITSHP
jgi:hypothetical protein